MRLIPQLATIGLFFAVPAAGQDSPAVNTVADALRVLSSRSTDAASLAAPAAPANNPGEWVTPDDYPEWAAAYNVTGRVGFVVDVDERGRVTDCRVGRSSGVPELDTIACEKVIERARFRAARNNEGVPVPGQWASTVVWQVSDEQAYPAPPEGYLVVAWVVERDGSVSSCEIERLEGKPADDAYVDDLCADGASFEPIVDAEGNTRRQKVRLMMRVVHEPLPQ